MGHSFGVPEIRQRTIWCPGFIIAGRMDRGLKLPRLNSTIEQTKQNKTKQTNKQAKQAKLERVKHKNKMHFAYSMNTKSQRLLAIQ
jgi:hypothetical protein